jgi:hypothetical protein
MLSQDYKLIFLFFLQILSLIIIFYVSIHAIAFRKWCSGATDEQQIFLEQKTYLLSSMLKAGVSGCFFSLFWFLHLLNTHFPSLIRGAMCAEGVLRAGEFGSLIIPLKMLILLLLSGLFFLNERDFLYSEMPFTPQKFVWLIPLALLTLFDTTLTFYFVGSLQPDLLTNCCSASSFAPSVSGEAENNFFKISGEIYAVLFAVFSVIFLLMLSKGSKLWLGAAEIFYFFAGFFSLQNFFTAYIYENFSHNCLYDLFLAENYRLGYVLFAAYFFILFDSLQNIMPYFYAKHEKYFAKKSLTRIILLFVSFLLTQITTVLFLFSDLKR